MNWDNRDLYKGFEINKNRIGWYGAIEGSLFGYIHRDGGIHQSCTPALPARPLRRRPPAPGSD